MPIYAKNCCLFLIDTVELLRQPHPTSKALRLKKNYTSITANEDSIISKQSEKLKVFKRSLNSRTYKICFNLAIIYSEF